MSDKIGENDDAEEVAKIMGFSGFGKFAKVDNAKRLENADKLKSGDKVDSDYMKIFEESLKLARERNVGKGEHLADPSSVEADDGSLVKRRDVIGPCPMPSSGELNENGDKDKDLSKKKEKKNKKEKKKKKDKKSKKKLEEKLSTNDDDGDVIGPPIPAQFLNSSVPDKEVNNVDVESLSKSVKDSVNEDNDDDDEDTENESDGEEVDPLFIPRSHEIFMDQRSGKPVTALGIDPSGSRLCSGGSDFDIFFWNFAGMDSGCRPFKQQHQPCGAHQIRSLDFNTTGDSVLVVCGSAIVLVMTRDGEKYCDSPKGYQYISNPRSTPGHTHALHAGFWNPRRKEEFITCSDDTSIRLWDVNCTETVITETKLKACKAVLVTKASNGRSTTPTTCAYSSDGVLIAGGCRDGSIQVWDTRKMLVNNSHLIRNAHGACDMTRIHFSYDSSTMLSRSMDDSLKLWDFRNLKTPLFHQTDLPCQYEQTECGFSPNDRLFFTATAVSSKVNKDNPGGIVFYDRRTLTPVENGIVSCSSGVIRCLWHPRINQILYTTATGKVGVLFDPTASFNGAKLCAFKPEKRKNANLGFSDVYAQDTLLTYNDDTVRDVRQGKRKSKFNEIEAANHAKGPTKKYQVEPPVNGPGSGGRLQQKGASLHQYMLMQMVAKRGEDPADKDIRGAILRHQEAAEKNPQWIGAYQKTQPKPVFAEPEEEETDPAKKPKMSQ